MIIDGISVAVTRKNIKRVNISVRPPNGDVSMSVPYSTSVEDIERVFRTKIGWVRDKQALYADRPKMMKRQYVYGETLYLWGKAYELQVFRWSRNSVQVRDGKVMMTVRSDTTVESRERQIREWYRRLLSAEIDRLLPKWEAMTGISCNSWQTRKMTTRWGTCNITERKIWFSLQLVKRPIECLEFIIVHELTHLVHKEHGVEFDALVEKHMPNWRDYNAMLSTPLNDDWVEG